MKNFMCLAVLFIAAAAFAQSPVPDLAQIKIAAEAGDAAAQDKLADQYHSRGDSAQAVIWYRKAALQGCLHAQGKLGDILLLRYEMHLDSKPETRAAIAAESLKWISLAASQDNKLAQADLAELCYKGTLVKQDFVEAYKWGEVASRGSPFEPASITGKSVRDSAILKMDTAQLEEARKRVDKFAPKSATPEQLAEPVWAKEIHLTGISGKPSERLAVINNRTFGVGDKISLKLGGKPVVVQCLEIHESSAVISVEGISGTREIKLN